MKKRSDSTSRAISELETTVTMMKAEPEEGRGRNKWHAAPSLIQSQENIEGTLIAKNPDLNLKAGDINAKFSHETKKRIQNLVIEVTAQYRKLLLQRKVKL